MKRFLTIQNNKLISDRFAEEIVEGEIESTPEFDNIEVGMVLIDGKWQIDPNEIAKQNKQLRISELKEIITNKKLLDLDCQIEKDELQGLLGL